MAVERVVRSAADITVVQLVTDDPEAARCPACRELSTSGKEWVLTRPRDLAVGDRFTLTQWRKRRWRCRTRDCGRRTFTEQVREVPARARTTTRLSGVVPVAGGQRDHLLLSGVEERRPRRWATDS